MICSRSWLMRTPRSIPDARSASCALGPRLAGTVTKPAGDPIEQAIERAGPAIGAVRVQLGSADRAPRGEGTHPFAAARTYVRTLACHRGQRKRATLEALKTLRGVYVCGR